MFFLFGLTANAGLFDNNLLNRWENAPALVVIIAFFIAWIIFWLPIGFILTKLLHWTPKQPLQEQQKIPLIVSLYLLVPVTLFLTNLLTNQSFTDYGWVGNFSILYSLLLGFGWGVLSLVFVFGCQFYFGLCEFKLSNPESVPSTLLSIILVALLVGAVEELVFRGFLLTQLEQTYSVWIGAIFSSLIFAILHLVWERRETVPQLPGLWLMGMVLVLARFADGGNLGLAWGLHAGWVWSIASIDTLDLVKYTDNNLDWITGKNKKPLAGVAGIFCMVITAAALYFVMSKLDI
ncbi:abortive infection protein [Calothrix parasitica NIES-267]|uniref:Abortive infection protein n=1 Tax=Calothrix parasitica NIES-267 TaxID=1973488 RepID=A0A1Z4LZ43_9CYAN|nr:abortive infection protein [Calothrix parasitica NIES-267]